MPPSGLRIAVDFSAYKSVPLCRKSSNPNLSLAHLTCNHGYKNIVRCFNDLIRRNRTDGLAGYMLHHELELYVRAGIPPAEVLRMATFTPSLVMGVNKDRGVIAAGKLADMVLIEGDPVRDIHDITKVATVIKGGKVYNPASIEKALGIAPRKAAQ